LRYRSRFEIVAVMLQASVGGATKTKLMYQAFLSHNQMVEYLEFLLGKRLIALTKDEKHYVPTEKGLHFLEMYAEIKDSVSIRRPGGLDEGKDPTLEGLDKLPQPPPPGSTEGGSGV
jgi:predicted transcriptional regulator